MFDIALSANELLALSMAGLGFLVVLFCAFFGRVMLLVWVIVALILANICAMIVIKLPSFQPLMDMLSPMFGPMVATMDLGTPLYATIFLTTDIITRCYGGRETMNLIWKALFFLFVSFFVLYILGQFEAAPFSQESSEAARTLFQNVPNLYAGAIIGFFAGQVMDKLFFQKIDRLHKHSWGFLWASTLLSTVLSQVVDSYVFAAIYLHGWADAGSNQAVSLAEHGWLLWLSDDILPWLVAPELWQFVIPLVLLKWGFALVNILVIYPAVYLVEKSKKHPAPCPAFPS